MIGRRWLLRTGLILASTIVIAAVAEIGLRIVDPYDGVPGLASYHPTREYQLTPGFRGHWYTDVYMNDLAFRDRDRSVPMQRSKAPGVRRIMIFGDSYTFGSQNPIEETLPYLTERVLRQMAPGTTWEVINAGVPGYTTYQEFMYIQETLDAFQPDVVVLQYTMNDAIRYDPPVPDTPPMAQLRPAIEWLRGRSQLVTYLHVALRQLGRLVVDGADAAWYMLRTDDPVPLRKYYSYFYAPSSAHFRSMRDAMQKADAYLAAHVVPMIVAIYPEIVPRSAGVPTSSAAPTFGEIYPLRADHEKVAATASAGHAFVLDLLDTFADEPFADVFAAKEHPGRRANELAATVLARCVLAATGVPLDRSVRCQGRP